MAVHEVHWPANSLTVVDDWQHISQHPRHAPLLTPPYTLHPNHQQPMTTVLPPIASFDTRNPYITPASMTAQHLEPYFHSNAAKQYTVSPPPRLPPIHTPPSFSALAGPSRPITPEPTPPPVEDSTAEAADWLFDTQKLASQTLAEKTCEMICYLWFSKAAATSDSSKQTSPHLTYMPHRSANTAHLQFSVSSIFVSFMHKLLQTTQLSQSVIVLSLHYVYRLKARNGTTVPSPGSEFRVAVAGLMMANKFVDDNTYTNKTWSEVSGIELSEINKMEREFLAGINFELYVDKQTYESWVNLLKGLVMSKERDSRYFRKSRQARAAPVLRPAQVPPLVRPRQRNYGLSPRARSSSPPRPYSGTVLLNESEPSSAVPMDVTGSLYRLHGKRTAVDAFSPTSATFNVERPPKRPTGLSLNIPQSSAGRAPVTPSPLESIQFSKLSLGSSPAISQTRNAQEHANVASRHISPQTLVAAYRLDPTKPRPAPQNLYFYSLAGSPLADDNRPRKGRLHFHQPPTNQVAPQYSYASQPTPVAVQSAHASPHERVYHLPPVLPHPYDGTWTQPRTYYDPRSYAYEPRAQDSTHLVAQPVAQDLVPVQAPNHVPQDSVRSAPFANAGPPGVHYYPYAVMPQVAYDDMWARGRRP